jgi:transmembrane sensor
MERFETNEEIIYALIIEDLDQTISPENRVILMNWRASSAENEKTYQDFLSIQVNLDKLSLEKGFDVETSWTALDEKLSSARVAPAKIQPLKLWMSVAATVLVVFGLGYYFLGYPDYEVIATADKSTSITLPDGTHVHLNAGTEIKYSKRNFKTDRELQLIKGEAFVDVIKHDGVPFHVSMGNIEAYDIGTSFNLIKDSKSIQIIVEEGIVAMKDLAAKKEVRLSAGKIGTYDLNSQQLHATDNLDLNYKAWLNKRFVFKDASLTEVVSQLEKAYHFPVSIDGTDLKNRKLTANLHYETLDSALAVISASLQCKTIKLKDAYMLSDN